MKALAAVAVLIGLPWTAVAAGRPVTFPSLDGTALAGQLYEALARPAPGVVLIHMLSRSKADWDDLAEDLAGAGITALALDLRGHGASGGAPGPLTAMVQDVLAAAQFLSARSSIRPDALGLVGASLGANLALLAAAEAPLAKVVAVVSPSLDYRGVRVGPELMRKLGNRGVWFAASTEDPFALRTLKDLTAGPDTPRDQQLSTVAAHGTNLLMADRTLARALVDWLRQTLIF